MSKFPSIRTWPVRWQPRKAAARCQHGLLPDPHLLDLLRDRLEPGAHVAQRQAGPVGEVAIGRRREGAEVPASQLRQSLLPVELAAACRASPPGGRDTSACRDRARDRRVPRSPPARRCAGRSAGSAHARGARRAPRARSGSAGLRRRGRWPITRSALSAARAACRAVRAAGATSVLDPRLEERQPPARVIGGDQVDRHPHHPGAEQRALLGAGAPDVRRRQASCCASGMSAAPRRRPAPGRPPIARAISAGSRAAAGRWISWVAARSLASRSGSIPLAAHRR